MSRFLLSSCLLALGLGACGGDDDSGTDATSDAALCRHLIQLCGSQIPITQQECESEAANNPPTASERQCVADATACDQIPACDPDNCACDVDFECSAGCACDVECSGDAGTN